MIYLDTHVAVWLYLGQVERLPRKARRLIESHDLNLSPMAALEIEYLHETAKLRDPAERVVDALRTDIGLNLCNLPFSRVVRAGWAESWTRDPFDRLIVAQARLQDAPLVSKDGEISSHYPGTVWD